MDDNMVETGVWGPGGTAGDVVEVVYDVVEA